MCYGMGCLYEGFDGCCNKGKYDLDTLSACNEEIKEDPYEGEANRELPNEKD